MSAIEGTLSSVLFTALIMSSENGSSLVMLHSILSHLEPLSYSLLHENVSVMRLIVYLFVKSQKNFLNKNKCIKDGTLKNQPSQVGVTTILFYYPYILCHFAICRRVIEGSGVGSAGRYIVNLDVHGEVFCG